MNTNILAKAVSMTLTGGLLMASPVLTAADHSQTDRSGMAGMSAPKAGGKPGTGGAASGGYTVRAAVTPNPPVVDVNTVEFIVLGKDGKPATGLKLSAAVAMTNMDMGTARPKVQEIGGGRYRVAAEFTMKGPWRVAITEGAAGKGKPGRLVTALDFMAGGKAKWSQAGVPSAAASAASGQVSNGKGGASGQTSGAAEENAGTDMGGMDTSNMDHGSGGQTAESGAQAPAGGDTGASSEPAAANVGPGMNKPGPKDTGMEGMAGVGGYEGGSEPAMAHPLTAQVPVLKPKRVVTVQGDEDWEASTGFGNDESMVAMMNLMMVGGSGMEGMKMGAMKPGASMAGMEMGGASGSGGSPQGLPVEVTVSPNPPVVGDNAIELLVKDASGKPLEGLKLDAAVAMTNMDMGTSKPKVEEIGGGRYRVTAEFTMKGPWRVTLSEAGRGKGKSGRLVTALDFNAGSKAKWAQRPARNSGNGAGNTGVMPGMDMGSLEDGDSAADDSAPAPSSPAAHAGHEGAASPASPSPNNGQGSPPAAAQDAKGTPRERTVPGAAPGGARSPAQPEPMPGMDHSGTENMPGMGAEHQGGQGSPAASQSAALKVVATLARPKVGENALNVRVQDAGGKPVAGAKVTATVAMTSMDMGTAKPTVKEVGKGLYRTTVTFSMKGPWRVTLGVTAPGKKAVKRSFDFNVPK